MTENTHDHIEEAAAIVRPLVDRLADAMDTPDERVAAVQMDMVSAELSALGPYTWRDIVVYLMGITAAGFAVTGRRFDGVGEVACLAAGCSASISGGGSLVHHADGSHTWSTRA